MKKKDYKLKPVPFNQVQLKDSFWLPRLKVQAESTVPHALKETEPAAQSGSPAVKPPCPYQQIVDLYHEILPGHPRVKIITNKRKSHMKARWINGASDLQFWRDYFETVSTSKFLTGRTQPSPGRKVYIADIDFLIREDALVKTQEGKYHE